MSPALLFHIGRMPGPVSHRFLKGTDSLAFSGVAAQEESGIGRDRLMGGKFSCSSLKVCLSSR